MRSSRKYPANSNSIDKNNNLRLTTGNKQLYLERKKQLGLEGEEILFRGTT